MANDRFTEAMTEPERKAYKRAIRYEKLEAVAGAARVYMSALRDIPEHGLSSKALELLAALDALDALDKGGGDEYR